jgi:hypothetical protein
MPQTLNYAGVNYPSLACVNLDEARPHVFLEDDESSNPFPVPTYTDFKLSFVFQQMPFGLKDDDFTTAETQRYWSPLKSDGQVEYMTLPGGILRYAVPPGLNPDAFPGSPTGGIPIQYGICKPIVSSMVAFKWWRVPYGAWGANAVDTSTLWTRVYGDEEAGIEPLQGKTNKTTWQNYPPGSLLFLGIEEERELDPALLTTTWALTFKFMFKPNGVNYAFALQTGGTGPTNGNGWYQMTVDGARWPESLQPDGECLFDTTEFAFLTDIGA